MSDSDSYLSGKETIVFQADRQFFSVFDESKKAGIVAVYKFINPLVVSSMYGHAFKRVVLRMVVDKSNAFASSITLGRPHKLNSSHHLVKVDSNKEHDIFEMYFWSSDSESFILDVCQCALDLFVPSVS